MTHPNVDRIRQSFEAYGQTDRGNVRDAFTEDVVFHVAGRNPYSGTYRGRQEVFEMFGRRNDAAGGSMKLTVHSVVADDEHAVALLEVEAERDGRAYSWRTAGIYHMRDGQIAEAWGFNEDQYAVDEFWS